MGLFDFFKKGATAEPPTKAKKNIGEDTIVISHNRTILPLVEEGKNFPLGTKRLLPVITKYGNGERKCFAFAVDYDQDRMRKELKEINKVLDEASKLCTHEFGQCLTLAFNISLGSWDFTRVEYAPYTSSGSRKTCPLRVRFESNQALCSPGSYSGIIDYKTDGYISKTEVTDWVDQTHVFKVVASFIRDEIKIKKIMQLGQTAGDEIMLYRG